MKVVFKLNENQVALARHKVNQANELFSDQVIIGAPMLYLGNLLGLQPATRTCLLEFDEKQSTMTFQGSRRDYHDLYDTIEAVLGIPFASAIPSEGHTEVAVVGNLEVNATSGMNWDFLVTLFIGRLDPQGLADLISQIEDGEIPITPFVSSAFKTTFSYFPPPPKLGTTAYATASAAGTLYELQAMDVVRKRAKFLRLI